MKSLIYKINKTLCSHNGEMLIEAIISIMLLTILLTVVTTMISTSLRMTSNSMVDAKAVQEEMLNLAFSAQNTGTSGTITIEAVDLPSYITVDINATHFVSIFENTENIIAFFPDPDGGVP